MTTLQENKVTMSQIGHTQTPGEIPPQSMMFQFINGYWITQLIYAVTKLGIADLLKDGPLNCNKLASSTGTHARSLYRVMRALASVGIFAENEQGDFTLTPLATCLRSDVPDSLRAFAIMSGEEVYQAWGDILYSLRTGANAFEHLYGMDCFQYYAQNPQAGQIFDQAMTNGSVREISAATKAYDFSKIQKLVDVGGGHGSLMASILKSNPNLKGVLYDLPSVVEGAKNLLKDQGVLSRCEVVSGDFFTSVPAGGDAYILKGVIHDWDDERAIAILKNCHQAMVENGLLLVVEMVIPPGNNLFVGKLLDIHMLIKAPGGCERTEAEYRTLFERAGFKLTNIFPTQANVSVIEGVRV
jgi:hypothetical protein